MFLVKTDYSNKNIIIKGLITAIFLSAFIYLKVLNVEVKLFNTVFALLGFYLLLEIPKKSLFYTGFFVGIFWFYWVGISVQYYDLLYLSPLVILFFAIAYGIIFYLFAIVDKVEFRLLALFAISFISPLGFNWFKPELILVDSYFSITKESYILILVSVYALMKLNKKLKILVLIPLYLSLSSPNSLVLEPNINVFMPQLNVTQDIKWSGEHRSSLIRKNLDLIKEGIDAKKDLIILPETSFTTILNKSVKLLSLVKNYSMDIDIVVGSLYKENGKIYNATYHFSKGKMKIAKKVVLVPFGEEIPFPKFITDIINDIFYGGAEDYAKASEPTDFNIKNIRFRNAICYEATHEDIYQNLNNVQYVIAMSNNAWFTPSIEPILQSLLLKYYAKKYNVMILHSVNGSKNEIIKP